MTSDEIKLVRGLQARDAESFTLLYRNYGTRIYRFCRRLCGNDTDAEDLTQDVFLAVFRGAEQFEGRSSLSTWLYRIALYRWRNLRRIRKPTTVSLDEQNDGLVSNSTYAELEAISLENALAALPENVREAFLLVKGEGLTCREAAEALGIPEGTLKSRVYSAVVRLQQLLVSDENPTAAKSSGSVRHKTEVCDEM